MTDLEKKIAMMANAILTIESAVIWLDQEVSGHNLPLDLLGDMREELEKISAGLA